MLVSHMFPEVTREDYDQLIETYAREDGGVWGEVKELTTSTKIQGFWRGMATSDPPKNNECQLRCNPLEAVMSLVLSGMDKIPLGRLKHQCWWGG